MLFIPQTGLELHQHIPTISTNIGLPVSKRRYRCMYINFNFKTVIQHSTL